MSLPAVPLHSPDALSESSDHWDMIPLSKHPVAVYLARLAPGSRRTMRQKLDRCARLLTSDRHSARTAPWDTLTPAHLGALRSALAEQGAPSTAKTCLAAVRGVLQETWRLGYITSEQIARLRDIPPVRGERLSPGRALTRGELVALFESCAEDHNAVRGARDAALLALLYGCGLRRGDVEQATVDALRDRGLRIVRKGNREQFIPIPRDTRRAVLRWIEHRGLGPGPLILTLGGQPLRSDQVYRAVQARRRRAGVVPFTPHDLRRTYISHLLDRGADLVTVQRLAGHRRIETTAHYDRRPEGAARRAADLLTVPYVDPAEHVLVGDFHTGKNARRLDVPAAEPAPEPGPDPAERTERAAEEAVTEKRRD